MSVIVNIQLETDLSEFTSTVEDSGDLYWSADAALAGTSGGMACLIDDTTAIYGTIDVTANTSGVMRARFYFDPNTLSMADSSNHYLLAIYTSGGQTLGYMILFYTTAAGFGIRLYMNNDAGVSYTNEYSITAAEHYIEYQFIRATTDISSDGSLQLWIDGTSKQTIIDIDNYDTFYDYRRTRLGPVSGLDATTSGTFYYDELVVNDDGSEIGPVAPAADLSIDIGLDEAAYQGMGVRII